MSISKLISTLRNKGRYSCSGIPPLLFSVQDIENPPFLHKGLCMVDGLLYNHRGRQHSLLSPLDYPPAKTGGAVNGGAKRRSS